MHNLSKFDVSGQDETSILQIPMGGLELMTGITIRMEHFNQSMYHLKDETKEACPRGAQNYHQHAAHATTGTRSGNLRFQMK